MVFRVVNGARWRRLALFFGGGEASFGRCVDLRFIAVFRGSFHVLRLGIVVVIVYLESRACFFCIRLRLLNLLFLLALLLLMGGFEMIGGAAGEKFYVE